MSEALLTFAVITGELVALFIALSFLVALALRRVGEARIAGWLGGAPLVGIAKGVTFGAVTPFCSCSTIPVLAGMLRAGVPFATAAAFLVASPLVDPLIFGATAVLFGWQAALAFTLAATLGTFAIAYGMDRAGFARYIKRVRVSGGHQAGQGGIWRGLRAELAPALRRAIEDFKPMIKPMLIGVSIGAFIYGAVPTDLMVSVAGPGDWWAVPVAALIALPLYVRAETALPIGFALLERGMPLGAVFAFVIAGAGVSPPEFTLLTRLFQPRLLTTFAGAIFALAVLSGLTVPMIS